MNSSVISAGFWMRCWILGQGSRQDVCLSVPAHCILETRLSTSNFIEGMV